MTALLVCGACQPAVIVDVPNLVGKSQDEVKVALGEPKSCDTVNPSRIGASPKCVYKDGSVEVVFIAGKADWITVNRLSRLKFSPAALAAFGLPETSPAFSNDNVIRWRDLAGVREVSLFPGQSGRCDFAEVKAVTD